MLRSMEVRGRRTCPTAPLCGPSRSSADDGIDARVPQSHWQGAVDALIAHAREGRVADGFIAAIDMCGAVLAKHFPRTDGSPSELPDRMVMGRRTFEVIGRALPQRHNIVVTRDHTYVAEGCTIAHSAEGALSAADGAPEIAVIGGAQVFQELLPLADILHVTYVHAEIDGDTFFPRVSPDDWRRPRSILDTAEPKRRLLPGEGREVRAGERLWPPLGWFFRRR